MTLFLEFREPSYPLFFYHLGMVFISSSPVIMAARSLDIICPPGGPDLSVFKPMVIFF